MIVFVTSFFKLFMFNACLKFFMEIICNSGKYAEVERHKESGL
jgi:hypothetical protein